MYKISVGELRHIIIIQQKSQSISEEGKPISTWVDFKTVYAKAKSLYGSEFWAAQAVNGTQTIKFITRYTPGITNDMRIIFKGTLYEIIAPPDNIEFRNQWLEIKAKVIE